MAALARRIVAARQRAGLSQADLGAASGIHAETVSRIERGMLGMRVSSLLAIASALGVSVSELVGELEPQERPAPKVSAVARRLHGAIDALPVDAQRVLLDVTELLTRKP